MNQKPLLISMWLFCTLFSSFKAISQTETDSIYSPVTRSYLEAKQIIGFWYSADSINQKVEFVDDGYQLVLNSTNTNPYYFLKDSTGKIYSSGFFPMWPPPGCDLDLISKDSLNITFSPFFTPGEPILYVRKKNRK
ncbi:MAG: hypothetical protein KBD57_10660 [Bacteroidia bacterium]|jgi:hypothetical protein|nr:hypothetical protein [Bacteroidia bacterium]